MKQDKPKIKYVNTLPDLMTQDDYADTMSQQKVRVRICVSEKGVEIIGDSQIQHLVDDMFEAEGAKVIEKILCG